MRSIILGASLLALASCGSEEPQKAKAPEAPASLPAGQWTTQLHVTSYNKMDQGRPGLVMEPGQQIAGGACVGANDGATPPPELFVGEGYDCNYMPNAYIRNGRINAFLACRRPGVAGDINVGIDGRYTADGIDGQVSYTTALVGDGDFVINTRLTSRRTGACQAGSGGESNSANKAG